MAEVTQEELDIAEAELELAHAAATQAAAVKPKRTPDTSMLAKAKAALMGATYNAAPRIVELNSPDLFKKSQAQADEDLRNRQRDFLRAAKDNPGSDLAGAVLSPNPFGKLSLPGRVLAGGGLSAFSGYLGADPSNEAARDEGGEFGFLTGVGGTLLGEGLVRGGGKVLGKVSSGLKDFGRGRALNTLSPSKADMAKILESGRATDMADDLYKSGVIGPLSNTGDVAENLAPLVQSRGAQVGATLKAVDAPDATFPWQAAQKIRDNANAEWGLETGNRGALKRALEEADAISAQHGLGSMSIADSEKLLKRPYDSKAVKALMAEARGNGVPDETAALDLVRRSIKEANEAAFDARAAGTPLEGQFVKAKKSYGLAAEALNVADRHTNRPAHSGDTLAGMAAAMVHNQMRTRGAALMTHAGYKGSKLTGVLGELADSANASQGGAAAFRRYLLEHSAKPGSDDAAQHFLDGN